MPPINFLSYFDICVQNVVMVGVGICDGGGSGDGCCDSSGDGNAYAGG